MQGNIHTILLRRFGSIFLHFGIPLFHCFRGHYKYQTDAHQKFISSWWSPHSSFSNLKKRNVILGRQRLVSPLHADGVPTMSPTELYSTSPHVPRPTSPHHNSDILPDKLRDGIVNVLTIITEAFNESALLCQAVRSHLQHNLLTTCHCLQTYTKTCSSYATYNSIQHAGFRINDLRIICIVQWLRQSKRQQGHPSSPNTSPRPPISSTVPPTHQGCRYAPSQRRLLHTGIINVPRWPP